MRSARHGVLFGVAFLLVTVMHLTLYALAARGDPDLGAAILRLAPSALGGAALIIVAGFVDGRLKPVLWLAALAVGYLAPLVTGCGGWRVQPAHFIERHGLIVIIAIGESLVAIGLGERASGLSTGVITAAILGFAVATSFWLAYFDFFPIRAHRLLAERSGVERAALARDVYTYLHLPMVTGIVLFAFAMKETLADVGGELATVPALGLCGGPALYLLAYVALRVRVSRTLSRGRLTAAIACAAAVAGGDVVPALVALHWSQSSGSALHAYELIWWRQAPRAEHARSVMGRQRDWKCQTIAAGLPAHAAFVARPRTGAATRCSAAPPGSSSATARRRASVPSSATISWSAASSSQRRTCRPSGRAAAR